MLPVLAIPLLLGVLVILVISLVAWGFLRDRSRKLGDALISTRIDLLVGLLLIAAFTLGVFLTYVLLGLRF